MIALYVGRRGCGKTTTLVKDAYAFKLAGWRVITNMTSLSFADEVMETEDILALLGGNDTDVVVVLDEIQTFIDSRRSMRKRNVEFTYYIQQIRKRNVVILAATQFSRRVDVAFREHVDIIVKPTYLGQFPVVVVRYIDRTVLDEGGFLDDAMVEMVYDPRAVFSLFDTREVIDPGVGVPVPASDAKSSRTRTAARR